MKVLLEVPTIKRTFDQILSHLPFLVCCNISHETFILYYNDYSNLTGQWTVGPGNVKLYKVSI